MLPPSAAAMSEGVENRPPQQEAAASAMPQPPHGKKREAWGEQPTAPPPAASSASQHTATSWLALLNDLEAALAEFRASHWEEGKVQQRDELKLAVLAMEGEIEDSDEERRVRDEEFNRACEAGELGSQ